MTNIQKEICIFIRGIPGTGKSSISKLLATRFAKSIVISQDDIRHMVIGGRVATESSTQPFEDPTEYHKQNILADEASIQLANLYYSSGYIPIIEGFNAGESGNIFQIINKEIPLKWYPDSEELSEKLDPQFLFIILQSDPPKITERLKHRGWSIDVIDFVLQMGKYFDQTVGDLSSYIRLDTTNISINVAVDQIMEHLNLI